MCGIVGLVGQQESSWLSDMNALERHRGPDDQGEYRDPAHGVGLAMRRLSILDLAGGHQPMSNEKGTIWIVFNGEIFNSPELRAELEKNGRQFRTSSRRISSPTRRTASSPAGAKAATCATRKGPRSSAVPCCDSKASAIIEPLPTTGFRLP